MNITRTSHCLTSGFALAALFFGATGNIKGQYKDSPKDGGELPVSFYQPSGEREMGSWLNGIKFHFGASAEARYDDNIRISESNEQEDLIVSLSPFMEIRSAGGEGGMSSGLQLKYTPSYQIFTKDNANDVWEHEIELDSSFVFSKTTIQFLFDFEDVSGSDIDASDRIRRRIYTPQFNMSYEVSPKTTLGLKAKYRNTDYKEAFDSQEISVNPSVDYSVTDKIRLGLGVTGGILDVKGSNATGSINNGQQQYLQARLRTFYTASTKLRFSSTIGGETRWFDERSSDARQTFVFDVGVRYDPFPNTQLGLNAFRRVTNSAVIAGSDYSGTGFSFKATQRFMERFRLVLHSTFYNSNYFSAHERIESVDREDDYFTAGVDFIWAATEYLSLSTGYLYRTNDSNVISSEFDNNQFFVRATLTF